MLQPKQEVIKVTNESVNREALGARSLDSNNISREEADYVLQKYAASGQVSTVISSIALSPKIPMYNNSYSSHIVL